MSMKRIPPTATRADVFMYIVRVFLFSVVKGFALGMNNHEKQLDEALQAIKRHNIAPAHLVNVSNALVTLLKVANAEYDAISRQEERLN